MSSRYEYAKQKYAELGVDTDCVLDRLNSIPISIHCWQTDDIIGFEKKTQNTTGGIQATGNFPGKAVSVEEVMQDLEFVLKLVPGKYRLNLHAMYGFFGEEVVARDKILEKHFDEWIAFAKKLNVKLDFNATFFSHELSAQGTLSHSDEDIRSFWVRHGIQCLKISQYIAEQLDDVVLYNIWIPDGLKDIPSDRLSPRQRLQKSLDEILAYDYDKRRVKVSVESKVFGIGVESYTVGSHEFYLSYAMRNNILPLIDIGHFHPTENVADKLSALSLFNDKIALHVTRNVRWDSDHILLLNDQLKEVAEEIVKLGEDKFLIGLDFFDANINRIVAYVLSIRNFRKALLSGLLKPNETLAKYQNDYNFTDQLLLNESVKDLPIGDVWNHYLEIQESPAEIKWQQLVEGYTQTVLMKRGNNELR